MVQHPRRQSFSCRNELQSLVNPTTEKNMAVPGNLAGCRQPKQQPEPRHVAAETSAVQGMM
jgi:hypothetical protein